MHLTQHLQPLHQFFAHFSRQWVIPRIQNRPLHVDGCGGQSARAETN